MDSQLVPLQIVSAHRAHIKNQEIARLSTLLGNDISANEELILELQSQSKQLDDMMQTCKEKYLALGL
jgi:hypothetical protein